MAEEKRAAQYHRGKKIFFVCGVFLDIFLLYLFFFSGFSSAVKQLAQDFSQSIILINGAYLFLFFVVFWVIHLPMHYYEGYIWEHKFSLSRQNSISWFVDEIKRFFLGFIIGMVAVEVIYFVLAQSPKGWWIWAGFFWLLMSFLLARLMPTVIVPVFFKYKPLGNEELRSRIRAMFQNCRLPLKDVYAVDFSSKTKKANAFFCGIGNNRRVVLSDTLIENFSIPEVEAVVAHEIGHYKNHDILRFLSIQTVLSFAGFYLVDIYLKSSVGSYRLTGIDDIVFFPMMAVAMIYLSLLTTPFLNFYSRVREVEADRFSLQTTQDRESFISMMEKLGQMNLAEKQPDKLTEIFLYDHPPLEKRIAFARNFRFGT
jgi:STE24 endopeptidase